MKLFLPHGTCSGGKYVGAAVLARTSRQSGRSRLQSSRLRSLYLACGLLEIGHGESVVALRMTIINSVLSPAEPKRGSSGPFPSPVALWNSVRSFSASGSSSNLYSRRLKIDA